MQRRGAAQSSTAARPPNVEVLVPATSFGGLLRAYREQALLSQEKLAERAGLSTRTVRELEAGRVRRPRGSSVRLLAQALGLQGSRRQAFAAAARPHPTTPPGAIVHRGGEGTGGDPAIGDGVVLSLPPPCEGAGCMKATVLMPRFGDWLTTSLTGVAPTWTIPHAAGLDLAGVPADLWAPTVLVVAVAADPAVGRGERCPTCGRREVG